MLDSKEKSTSNSLITVYLVINFLSNLKDEGLITGYSTVTLAGKQAASGTLGPARSEFWLFICYGRSMVILAGRDSWISTIKEMLVFGSLLQRQKKWASIKTLLTEEITRCHRGQIKVLSVELITNQLGHPSTLSPQPRRNLALIT